MVKAVFKSINKTERMQRRDFNNQFALYNISQNISHCEMQNCFAFNLRYFAEKRINLIHVSNSQSPLKNQRILIRKCFPVLNEIYKICQNVFRVSMF